MISNFTQLFEIKVQENEATTGDSLFYNFNYNTVKYYNVNSKLHRTDNYIPYQEKLFVMYIGLDQTSQHYERIVYTFIDMFGFLGGLFDFLFFAGYFFVNYFSDKLFHNSILSNLYQVQSQDNNRMSKQH